MVNTVYSDLNINGVVDSYFTGKMVGSATSMPTASSKNNGFIVIYVGTSDGTYVKGTIYQSLGSSWTAIGTISDDSNVLSVENASVTWVSDTSVSGYPYKGTISLTGCTSSHTPIVTFGHDAALSGKYYPIAESATDKIYVWSKTNSTIAVNAVAFL